MERFRIVESKKSKMHPGGLKDWVENENWRDLRRKNKKGGYVAIYRQKSMKSKSSGRKKSNRNTSSSIGTKQSRKR